MNMKAPSLTDWRIGDEMLVQLEEACGESGWAEMVAMLAREVREVRAASNAEAPELHAVATALAALSARMRLGGDDRRYGVNASLRVVEALQRGADAGPTIDALLENR